MKQAIQYSWEFILLKFIKCQQLNLQKANLNKKGFTSIELKQLELSSLLQIEEYDIVSPQIWKCLPRGQKGQKH